MNFLFLILLFLTQEGPSTVYSSKDTLRKSSINPVMLSLFLPGLGEHSLGKHRFANRLFVLEGVTWLSYFTLNYFADYIEQNAITFALGYAGAKKGSTPNYYYEMEWNLTYEEYNEKVRAEARYLFTDRDSQLVYIEEHTIAPDSGWVWQSDSHRAKYHNCLLYTSPSPRD